MQVDGKGADLWAAFRAWCAETFSSSDDMATWRINLKALLWECAFKPSGCSFSMARAWVSDAFRAQGTCSSFVLAPKRLQDVRIQLCTELAESEDTPKVTSRRGFLKTLFY